MTASGKNQTINPRLAVPAAVFTVMLAGATVPANAEPDASTGDGSQLQQLLPQSCFLAGNFRQLKTLEGLKEPLRSSGQFIFSCERGLVWQTREPFPETVIYRQDGEHLRTTESESEKLSGRIHRELGNILNQLLGGDIAALTATFTVSTEAEGVVLQPKNKRMRKFMAAIHLTRRDQGVEIAMDGKQDLTHISIANTETFASLELERCQQLISTPVTACDWLYR